VWSVCSVWSVWKEIRTMHTSVSILKNKSVQYTFQKPSHQKQYLYIVSTSLMVYFTFWISLKWLQKYFKHNIYSKIL